MRPASIWPTTWSSITAMAPARSTCTRRRFARPRRALRSAGAPGPTPRQCRLDRLVDRAASAFSGQHGAYQRNAALRMRRKGPTAPKTRRRGRRSGPRPSTRRYRFRFDEWPAEACGDRRVALPLSQNVEKPADDAPGHHRPFGDAGSYRSSARETPHRARHRWPQMVA